jgi:hypothetical protein
MNWSHGQAKIRFTSDIAMQCLTFLCQWCTDNAMTGQVVLVWDADPTHKTELVVQQPARVDIRLVFIPAGGTDQYQPLDIAIFPELKNWAMCRLTDKHIDAVMHNQDTDFRMQQTIECVSDAYWSITQDNILKHGKH